MSTPITVTAISNAITVSASTSAITIDATTNEVAVNTTDNPVSVTQVTQEFLVNTRTNKEDIGLGNVDNTSDASKPLSDAAKLYVDTQVDYLTTDNVDEAGNLYYTQARTDARVAAGIAAIVYPVTSVNGRNAAVVLETDDVAEGVDNLYYTDERVAAQFEILVGNTEYPVTSVNGKTGNVTLSTSDISEGTNLYFTEARVATRSSVKYKLAPSTRSVVVLPENCPLNAAPKSTISNLLAIELVIVVAKLGSSPNAAASSLSVSNAPGALSTKTATALFAAADAALLT